LFISVDSLSIMIGPMSRKLLFQRLWLYVKKKKRTKRWMKSRRKGKRGRLEKGFRGIRKRWKKKPQRWKVSSRN